MHQRRKLEVVEVIVSNLLPFLELFERTRLWNDFQEEGKEEEIAYELNEPDQKPVGFTNARIPLEFLLCLKESR